MAEAEHRGMLPDIRVPALWTFAGLVGGLLFGLVLQRGGAIDGVLAIAAPIGSAWLRALQMTIIPLVCSLIFLGVVQTAAAAKGGAMARRTLLTFAAVLVSGAALAAMLMPALLELSPIPAGAAEALRGADRKAVGAVPGLGEFFGSLVSSNIVDAAARDAMLPLILFMALFALASTRLADAPRRQLESLFEAIAGAMMVVVGWVLKLAPIGVFALALEVAAKSGSAAVAALGHYIITVSLIGAVVMLAACALAMSLGKQRPVAFLRAMMPVSAVAISTQSSLASLPAMLAACRKLGISETKADFVLPLAVALLRATGPAMNLAVAIYVARLSGVALTPEVLVAGVLAASLTTLGAPSLPGSISFVTSVGPIALAMGAPLGPLALLVAVEMLPDIMRTLGNVTADVAVTAALDRSAGDHSALP